MFVSKKSYTADLDCLRRDTEHLSAMYWKLLYKHERLMKYLDLSEVEHYGIEIVKLGNTNNATNT